METLRRLPGVDMTSRGTACCQYSTPQQGVAWHRMGAENDIFIVPRLYIFQSAAVRLLVSKNCSGLMPTQLSVPNNDSGQNAA